MLKNFQKVKEFSSVEHGFDEIFAITDIDSPFPQQQASSTRAVEFSVAALQATVFASICRACLTARARAEVPFSSNVDYLSDQLSFAPLRAQSYHNSTISLYEPIPRLIADSIRMCCLSIS
jgi:hypothetical protein